MPLNDGTIVIKNVANGVMISFNTEFKVTNGQGQLVPIQSPWLFENGREAQASAKIIEVAGLIVGS